jgi:predicted nucleotidyltransferase
MTLHEIPLRTLPDVNDQVRRGKIDRQEVVHLARHLSSRFGGICFAFLFGSVLTGRFKPYSDVDLLIVVEGNESNRQLSLEDGYIFDLQILGMNGLEQEVRAARQTGKCHVLTALAQGEQVYGQLDRGSELQNLARLLLAAGPLYSNEGRNNDDVRQSLMVAVAELESNDDLLARIAVANTLFHPLIRAVALSLNIWHVPGYHSLPFLADHDAALAHRIAVAYEKCLAGDVVPLTNLANDVLTALGGPVWS